jgi:ubiquinone biosynthesis protein COQ4
MNDVPYLLRGVQQVTTQSSVLVSSSKYLNNAKLRDWMAMIALKRNGADVPAQAEMYELVGIIDSLQDYDEIESMLTEERKVNPALDAWFNAGHISDFTPESLQDYPEGSLGQVFYRDVIQANFDLVIYERPKPVTQYDYFRYRSGQVHDLEHILTGGDFNYMGELVPNWARITSVFKHFQNPKLAGEVSIISFCSILRYTIRTMFNYAEVWPVAQDAIERGMRVGRESGPFFLAKHEDFMHLPLEEARAAMGIRGALTVDTTVASRRWAECDG